MPKTISSLPTGAINKTDSIITATDGSDELKRNTVDELLAEPTAEIEALRAQIAEMEEKISQLNSDISGSATSDFTLSQNDVNRVGNVVNFRVASTSMSATGTSVNIAVMPENFRPSTARYILGNLYINGSYETVTIIINPDGSIRQNWTNNEFTRFYIMGTYMI